MSIRPDYDADRLVEAFRANPSEPLTVEADVPEPADLVDLLSRPLIAPRFAIPEVAPRGHVTIIYSGVGSGKTTLYQDAIVANEVGRAFLGLRPFTDEQMFVVFDWENGEGLAGTGAPQTLRRLGMPDKPERVNYYFDARELYLDTPKGVAMVRRILDRDGATCAIFDSRDWAFPNTPENEGRLILQAMQAAQDLARELDVALVLISHEPKAEYQDSVSKLRGHSAWGQLPEQMFRYIRRGDSRLLEHTKFRGINRRPSLKVELSVEGDDTSPIRLSAEEASTVEDRAQRLAEDVETVEGYLRTHGPKAWGELKTAMEGSGMNESRMRKAVEESKRSGRIGQDGRRQPYSYKGPDEEGAGQLAAI